MDKDEPFDLHAALTATEKKVPVGDDSDVGQLLNFGLRLARDAKRMIMAECERRYPDSVAHQCTAAMIASIIQFRAEENAALNAPEGSPPRNVWNNMVKLLVPENLGFADKDTVDEMDGHK